MQLEGLEFKVEGTSDSSAKSIQSLSAALSSLKSSLPGRSKIQNLVSSLESLNEVTGKMRIGTLKDLGEAVRNLSSAKVSASIAKNIEGIGLAARTITDDDVKRIQELSTALSGLQGIGSINLNIPGGVGNGTANNVAGGFTDIASIATPASGVIGSVLDTIKDKASGVTSAVTKIGHAFSRVGSVFKGIGSIPAFFGKDLVSGIKSATRSVGGLFAGLKRIAMYRMLRTAIKLFTEGLTTGLKNVYAYSQLVGTSFAHNMDLISTNALYAKNSLGAMAAPLIGALAPAIDFVTGKFVDLLNVVNMFIARLTGAETATIAKKTFSSWGDDANDAAGRVGDAVEKIKRTILGFDELNVLNAPNESGGGGGGGAAGGGADPGSMFEQVPIESGISAFADKLKEAFQNGEWEQVGTLLGNKFNEIVEDIPWGTIGSTMGNGIDAAIKIVYSTLSAANFVALGEKFGVLFNTAILQIDFETLGNLMVKKFTIIADLVIGAITKVNWGLVAKKASDFVIGVFSEISTWLQSVKWADYTTSLYNSLKSAISNVKYAEIASAISEALGSAFGVVLTEIVTIGKNIMNDLLKGMTSVLTGINTFLKDKVIKPITDGLANGDVLSGLATAGSNIIQGILGGIISFFTGIGTWIKTNILDPFVSGFKATFGIHSPASNPSIVDLGKQIILGVFQGIINWMAGVGAWLKTNVLDKIVAAWNDFWKDPLGFTIDFVATLTGWKKDGKSFTDTIGGMIAGFGSWVKATGNGGFISTIGGMIASFGSWVKSVGNGGFSNTIGGMVASFGNWIKQTGNGGFSNTIGGMIASFGGWIKQVGKDGFVNTIGGMVASFGSWIKATGNGGFSSFVGGMIAQFGSWVKKTGNGGFINTIGGMVAQFSSWVKATGKGGFSSFVGGMVARFTSWVKATGKGGFSSFVGGMVARFSSWVKATGKGGFSSFVTGMVAQFGSWVKKTGSGGFSSFIGGMVAQFSSWVKKTGSGGFSSFITGMISQFSSWTKKTGAGGFPNIVTGLIAEFTSWIKGFTGKPEIDVTAKITKVDKNGFSGISGDFAKGGAFYAGSWHSIPQYAAGAFPAPSHGSMFIAGEAGPEVVGHINGRSEVLNASQLASTMYDAVFSAMSAAGGSNRQDPVLYVTVRTENDEVLARAVTRGQRSLDARLNPT